MTTNVIAAPTLHFGRYSDAHKTNAQIKAYDAAVAAFAEGDYATYIDAFFVYLNNENTENATCTIEDSSVHFELIQGSKRVQGVVQGIANSTEIKASVAVLRCATAPSVGVLRRLLEQNASLRYCAYSLDANNMICLHFSSALLDCPPEKLYFALKELALTADKADDILLKEFSGLQAVDNLHIQPFTAEQQQLKYAFLQKWLTSTLQEVARLDALRATNEIAYRLLRTAYKIDYLLVPEGFTMDVIEEIHSAWNDAPDRSVAEKNPLMLKAIHKIAAVSAADFAVESYPTIATFSITGSLKHVAVRQIIDEQLGKMVAFSPPFIVVFAEYIAGFCLFNGTPPPPDKDLFELLYRIINNDFFVAIQDAQPLTDTDGVLQKDEITTAIDTIVQAHQARFPNLKLDAQVLDYTTLTAFCKSFLWAIRSLDL